MIKVIIGEKGSGMTLYLCLKYIKKKRGIK